MARFPLYVPKFNLGGESIAVVHDNPIQRIISLELVPRVNFNASAAVDNIRHTHGGDVTETHAH